MFETIKELFRLKQSIQERQQELNNLNEQISNGQSKLEYLNANLSGKETAIKEKEAYIANRDNEIERIKQEAHEEQQKVINQYKTDIENLKSNLH